jgi:hypothetical protein
MHVAFQPFAEITVVVVSHTISFPGLL